MAHDPSSAWSLDPQLERDTFALGDLPLSRVLLMNDANYPWLILVPRRPALVEIIDLAENEQAQLMAEIARASHALKAVTACDKLNVAAIGNVVAQLHVHIVARRQSDAAWPKPVWGHAPARPTSGRARAIRCGAAPRAGVGVSCVRERPLTAGRIRNAGEARAFRSRPMFRTSVLGFSVAPSCAAAASGRRAVHAAYPERPITLIVPFAPGGPSDIIARILATALSQTLGQNVIVDNRGGAAGNIGMGQAARATPDGYTLLLTSTAIAVNTALFKNLPYDPFKDFLPVSELVSAPNVLVVRPDSGIATIADLVARAKAEPTKFNYASPGAGTKSHLTGEMLKLRAGHRDGARAVPRRRAGRAGGACRHDRRSDRSRWPPAEALIKSGQLRALAVTSTARWFSLPDVPTMIEAGYPGFVSDTFNALFAPAGTPPEIVALLVKESRAAFARPEAREQARRAGFEIVAGTPEQLAARVAAEIEIVRELVDQSRHQAGMTRWRRPWPMLRVRAASDCDARLPCRPAGVAQGGPRIALDNDYVRVTRDVAPCAAAAAGACEDRVVLAMGDIELKSAGNVRKMKRGEIAIFKAG